MRIAVLSHLRFPVARPYAGGMEAHSAMLVEGLRRRGHDVVLFASGDSRVDVPLHPVLDRAYEADFPWATCRGGPALTSLLDEAYDKACRAIAEGGFDVVHNNSLHRFPLQRQWTDLTPTVTSLHVPPYPALHGFVTQSPSPRHRLTVTSGRQMDLWFPEGPPPEATILYNGVDPDLWEFSEKGNGQAVWSGRLSPEKGAHLAIAAARHAGLALTLCGPIDDRAYWDEAVQPLLGDGVLYGGHLSTSSLSQLVGEASVCLFTPCWDEPFGLAAVEAMMCGTPVASFSAGAAREIVGDGGVIADQDTAHALASAISIAKSLGREEVRRSAVKRFSIDRWLDGCEIAYAQSVEGDAEKASP